MTKKYSEPQPEQQTTIVKSEKMSRKRQEPESMICVQRPDGFRAGKESDSIPFVPTPSLFGLLLRLMLLILSLAIILEHNLAYAMSKRFLKGFIMGAMFAHHHKP